MSKRTKRGGYKQPARQGRARVRLAAGIESGGVIDVDLNTKDRLTDRQRLAAISGRIPGWRNFGPQKTIEPLNAGLKRYIRFPIVSST